MWIGVANLINKGSVVSYLKERRIVFHSTHIHDLEINFIGLYTLLQTFDIDFQYSWNVFDYLV